MAARVQVLIPLLMLIAAIGLPWHAMAQTSVFTYQGRLHDGGVPANGSYDLRYTLYTAGAGGSQVGSTIYADDMPIGSGLFANDLDFGPGSLPGADRWLEVAVRPGAVSNADRSPATYTALNPRQRLNSAPYAIRARDADTVDGFDSSVFLTGVPNPLVLDNDIPGPIVTVHNESGTGVIGASMHNAGVGLWGEGHGLLGIGVFGWARDLYGFSRPAGICGSSETGNAIIGNTSTGIAIAAHTFGATGSPRALVASTDAEFGKAVIATNSHASQGTSAELATRIAGSVVSPSINGRATALAGTSPNTGIYGRSGVNTGIWGESTAWAGVVGATTSGYGVWGHSYEASGVGVYAVGSGIEAESQGTALQILSGAIKVPGAGIGTWTPVFIHRATVGNTSGNTTTIDHPLTNGDANAILIVTPNWNPGGGSGTYNSHPIGVFYTSQGRWAVFNQDIAAMPVNAAFNVLVIKAGLGTEPPSATDPGSSPHQAPRAPIETGLEGVQFEVAKSGPRK